MKDLRQMTAALAALALLLPLVAGCGKYGKPVRASKSFAAPEPAVIHGIDPIDQDGRRERERVTP